MFQLFESLKSFVKPSSVIIDNHVQQLHYKATVLILLAFSLLVTARQYFGDPIDCMSSSKTIPQKMLDTFCWVHTTFSVENAWRKKVGIEIPYPGVDNSRTAEDDRVYHAYYQWVCFVLFIQALAFAVPRFIWKTVENGLVRNLLLGLNQPLLNDQDRQRSIGTLSDYLHNNMGIHNSRFLLFTFTEGLSLLNVLTQMMLLDRFLGGQFTDYGWRVLSFTEWDDAVRYDPMVHVFPRLTKCLFFMFGSSGDIERHDAMCLLPINILNEKLYIFLWFWFYALSAITAISLIYRMATICFPSLRVTVLHSHCRIAQSNLIRQVLKHCRIGDWFLLDLLAKNMEPINFRDLMIRLTERFDNEIDALQKIRSELFELNEKMAQIQKR